MLELRNYFGRVRRLIAHRFRTVGFGRVSVRNYSFYFVAEYSLRFSKLSGFNSPRVVVYISANNIFQRDFCIELS